MYIKVKYWLFNLAQNIFSNRFFSGIDIFFETILLPRVRRYITFFVVLFHHKYSQKLQSMYLFCKLARYIMNGYEGFQRHGLVFFFFTFF